MRVNRSTSFAMGAVAALVIGSGTAYAATGGNFILGVANTAETKTSLTNPNGVALELDSKAGVPSMVIKNPTRIVGLNADRLDGFDGSQLALVAGQTNTIRRTGVRVDVDANGTKDVIAAQATCPNGSRLTGGGYSDVTSDGIIFVNGPKGRTTWEVISTSTEDPAKVLAYAVCYNPRGAVAGGAFRQPVVQLDDQTKQLARARLGR